MYIIPRFEPDFAFAVCCHIYLHVFLDDGMLRLSNESWKNAAMAKCCVRHRDHEEVQIFEMMPSRDMRVGQHGQVQVMLKLNSG